MATSNATAPVKNERRDMRKSVMYVIGMAPLGLGYPWLKAELSGPMLLGAAIVYLLALRFICEKFGKPS
jgi:hypothetical protein